MEYRIQRASKILKVPRSTIRYWETKFDDLLKPKRTNGGQRRYSDEDIASLKKIKRLLHHKNKTINEANRIMRGESPNTVNTDWEKQFVQS